MYKCKCLTTHRGIAKSWLMLVPEEGDVRKNYTGNASVEQCLVLLTQNIGTKAAGGNIR